MRVGEEVMFKFEGRNNFTRKTRELATKTALEARGFGKDQVKAILMRTVHIAGRADLTEEQWLTIALRCATESACFAVLHPRSVRRLRGGAARFAITNPEALAGRVDA